MSVFNALVSPAGLAATVAAAGCMQAALGTVLVSRFRWQEKRVDRQVPMPPVSVLKPLHGDEPLLEEALESFCTQDYPQMQIVFGVQSEDDAAIPIVRRLMERHPAVDMELVVDSTFHGVNRKIGNLINIMRSVKHDVLVISDSDIHVAPDYLRHVVGALVPADVGLVTTLYAGLPASPTVPRLLAACQINHNFLPGVMLSRYLGRQDCLGATMALRRSMLEAIGGLEALVPHVADDAMLGRYVRERGKDIAIAACMTWTTVGETSMREVLAHELRWGRTVKTLEPAGYAASAIQLPLFWASVAVLLAPHAAWTWFFFAGTWAWRGVCSFILDRTLAQRSLLPLLLLPLRDWISAAIMVGSVTGTRVAWRGQTMHVTPHSVMTSRSQPASPRD
ncbi:ceramide glucosyltransferase [Komagataeibacter rhaeticus]|uniref:Glycosyltransferase n=1 Tax=Komagataeibacter rhaeticus TaxID=215221 RepID=A0A181CDL0_9PROT|nr:bacteriohopanetetrol glucosamine biosynthesis glycosyltransferase HpnI [Komagataeibacter rhaeticus]ATU71648.1 ceramide glucosyltransferase [Komagataeibacter xylinus]EGG77326.1 Ceramide glucosyltransferase [Gluconacetobacter sp. SXCC-1]KDU97350.1 ceramide glucosyltransferase [Komagataeibacter rhaeticus AF1]MBL7241192.1 bacteriohopanetetrol glucosamine biosynthesis glycosyltransferase HpnI [Komagataeibacter rhaeticus]PYD53264.1 ceramide glucosyltransferase [Komagataeibacter rhaeticus]